MTWLYEGKPFTETPIDYVGFVYIITFATGQKYIGKKIFWSTKRKIIKGKTKRLKVESNWRIYYGSSDYIKNLLTSGKDGATREIVRLCKTKSEQAYYEMKMIFEHDALLKPHYINRWVTCQINAKNLEYLYDANGEYTASVGNDGAYREDIEGIVSDI
jgi:hypothetical protein